MRKFSILCILLLVANLIFAQKVLITGIVLDESNKEPLLGATVRVKGSSDGTVTDFDGNFSLSVEKGSVLTVSFVGYVTKDVTLNANAASVRILLAPDNQLLEDVVIVGFGAQKKEHLTAAVSTISSDVLKNRPVQNVAQALMGVSPGLNISQDQGRLDKAPSINIRGRETIGEGSNGGPLILIDGMEGDMNTLNPQDIESISVLKDAAASSIYGSRAPFGVVLITTKSGSEGKVTLNYNNSFRWNTPVTLPKMADSYSFALFMNDADLWGNHFDDQWLQRIKDYQDGKLTTPLYVDPNTGDYANPYWGGANANVDWYKALFRQTSPSMEHTASISGGGEKTRVYASVNYLDMDGMLRYNRDEYNRLATNLKVDTKLWNYIDITYNMKFTRTDYGRPSTFTDDLYRDIARQGWPMFPLYDNNGNLYYDGGKAALLRDGGRDKQRNDTHSQQLKLRIEPLKDWQIMAELNYRNEAVQHHWDMQKIYTYTADNQLRETDRKESSVHEDAFFADYINLNIYSDYAKTFSNNHFFKVMAGFQAESYKNNLFGATRNGIMVPGIDVIDKTTGLDADGKLLPPTVNGAIGKWTTAGFFGRINYNYKNKYMIEGNLRYDGTSRFRRDNRWVWTPSVSLGWNIAHENFWESLRDIVSTLKLRASYGKLANQNTTSWYPTYVTMPLGTANGSWLINGQRPNTANAPGLVSTDLTWEKVQTTNIGLDIAMLQNRLNVVFDWYIRDTKDMIGPAPVLPATLGTDPPRMNNTDLRTRGWELSINWQDRLAMGLGYRIGLTLSDARTEITNYPSTNRALDKYYTGKKMGQIWGYTTIGIAKTDEEMQQHLASLPKGGQDPLGSNWGAGDIMYKDINGDGKIDWGDYTEDNPGDLSVIGNSEPRYRFGLNLSVDYKGFDLGVFFQGVLKQDFAPNGYTPTFFGAHPWGIWESQVMVQHLDYFRNDPEHPLGLNMNSYYPRPRFSGQNYEAQTKYLQNAAYLRLKNLQLGYTLPNKLTQKVNLSNVRIFVAGENLFTITKLADMFDPETVYGGWNGTVYPLSKTYSCGISLNF